MPTTVRIAVVDDESDLRLLARLVLESELDGVDLDILEVASGAEAVELCAGGHIDVVVLDMQMPEMGGLEVIKQVRQLPDPPFIVAWSADDHALAAAAQLGAA